MQATKSDRRCRLIAARVAESSSLSGRQVCLCASGEHTSQRTASSSSLVVDLEWISASLLDLRSAACAFHTSHQTEAKIVVDAAIAFSPGLRRSGVHARRTLGNGYLRRPCAWDNACGLNRLQNLASRKRKCKEECMYLRAVTSVMVERVSSLPGSPRTAPSSSSRCRHATDHTAGLDRTVDSIGQSTYLEVHNNIISRAPTNRVMSPDVTCIIPHHPRDSCRRGLQEDTIWPSNAVSMMCASTRS